MPTYVYELVEGECKMCGGRFELRRPMEREPLTACPLCKKPVRKCVGAVYTPKLLKKPSVSEAKSAGFTVYQNAGGGVYERK